MNLYSITDLGVKRLLDRLSANNRLIAPIEERGLFRFGPVYKSEDVRLDYPNTRLPPKFVFLPQSEGMFKYSLRDSSVAPCIEDTDTTILFGVRPCDASSLSILDPIMRGKYIDCYYDTRRKNTTIIALSCEKPRDTCFCNMFNAGPIEGTGADLTLTKIDGGYITKPASSRGRNLIKLNRELFHSASKKEKEKYSSIKKAVEQSMRKDFDLKRSWERLSQDFSDALWEELAKRCIGCGICSFVCPTCYCFDVCEISSMANGLRARGWDSCMFGTFSRMASGLDPRPSPVERIRHRFYHKFQYIPESFGVRACVGCGRCLALCPVNVDVKEVLGS